MFVALVGLDPDKTWEDFLVVAEEQKLGRYHVRPGPVGQGKSRWAQPAWVVLVASLEHGCQGTLGRAHRTFAMCGIYTTTPTSALPFRLSPGTPTARSSLPSWSTSQSYAVLGAANALATGTLETVASESTAAKNQRLLLCSPTTPPPGLDVIFSCLAVSNYGFKKISAVFAVSVMLDLFTPSMVT